MLCAISILVLFRAFLDMVSQRYPEKLIFLISLLFQIGKNDGGIKIIGVCVKRTSFPSLPLLRL
jgi:hypothetical protein